jgi:hypothetical protein
MSSKGANNADVLRQACRTSVYKLVERILETE